MKSIFLQALNKEKTKRPPVWFMRQAGRILPSYLELRDSYSFRELMDNPKLASKVTRLPLHELDVDAAILFSDILVIPESLGMNVKFLNDGPKFNKLIEIDNYNDNLLKFESKSLEYIYENIKQTKKDLHSKPLIGFCGGPLTVFIFMFKKNNSIKEFHSIIKNIYTHRKKCKKILEKITEASIEYVENQIENGIDCFQLFETYCGLIPEDLYFDLIMPYATLIMEAAKKKGCKTIFFPKNLSTGLRRIQPEMCDYVSVDWQINLEIAREILNKKIGIQGNMDPRLFFSSNKEIDSYLFSLKSFGKKNNNWIFNLGHGFIPGIEKEKVERVVKWIKNHNWER
ncbi:MAG: uroporphyrinogen decarboxylase [Flavobacteriales bacterium]|nr:uroporphyrinogen decarboxylase [Flavobacteriales bacterium]|tara:strand:+ start:7948 stop:8973 length:1026 start_codon:yes stop_codon:yes gene_type:complete